MKEHDDAQLLTLVSRCEGVSLSKLTEWRNCDASPGRCPHSIIDYRKAANPYQARYGATWVEEISKTSFMNKYMSIRELVQKIHDRSESIFKGTVHEEDWFFYHDALSQLTAKSTVAWMEEKGYYKRWLIPQLGLNFGTIYFGRCVGNRPEWMPLDMSLNNDIQLSLSLHCAITAYLPDEDPRKFSLATPKSIVSGIRRIYGTEGGNVPCSDRIIEDCNRALRAFGVVYEHGGRMVPGLANRNGHRNNAAGRNRSGWGGLRIKNLLAEELDRWLHADAVSAKNSRTDELLLTLGEDINLSDEEEPDDV